MEKYILKNTSENKYFNAPGYGLCYSIGDAYHWSDEEIRNGFTTGVIDEGIKKIKLYDCVEGPIGTTVSTPHGSLIQYPQKTTGNWSYTISSEDLAHQDNSTFKKTLDSINSLLEYKNKKYGNAALEPLGIFEGKCKVGQRLDDKLARVKNGDALKKNDIVDLIGYLTLACVENGWDNFDEFKD